MPVMLCPGGASQAKCSSLERLLVVCNVQTVTRRWFPMRASVRSVEPRFLRPMLRFRCLLAQILMSRSPRPRRLVWSMSRLHHSQIRGEIALLLFLTLRRLLLARYILRNCPLPNVNLLRGWQLLNLLRHHSLRPRRFLNSKLASRRSLLNRRELSGLNRLLPRPGGLSPRKGERGSLRREALAAYSRW